MEDGRALLPADPCAHRTDMTPALEVPVPGRALGVPDATRAGFWLHGSGSRSVSIVFPNRHGVDVHRLTRASIAC